jgi:hypothetical protein
MGMRAWRFRLFRLPCGRYDVSGWAEVLIHSYYHISMSAISRAITSSVDTGRASWGLAIEG